MAKTTSRVADVYGNRAFKQVTMSAANTLTFEQIQFGVGLFQGVAMVLNRIEWSFGTATWRELVANTDSLAVALTNRDDLSSLDPTNQSVLVYKSIVPLIVGAVVSLEENEQPVISDFSTLPGMGLIIPANPIYIGMITEGFAAAGIVRAVMYFTFKQLTDAEYIELMQTIMPANI